MRFPNKKIVDAIRKNYTLGSRVELMQMEDAQAPPIGTKGTVMGVDDTGSIMVKWDTGSRLNVVYGEDFCRRLESVITVCYGEKRLWDSREDAEDFFLRCMAGSEGSEQARYITIYAKLTAGFEEATDDE